ncbi:MAG: TonB-dependent receptor plug domain-containing protein [Gemmatimonadota bacterium]
MIVMKFGGTSVEDATAIRRLVSIVRQQLARQPIVVVSAMARVPSAPRVGTANLLPAGSRIILTRDSIEFMNAETIGDVISEVPGVFLWRGGWLGRPELPNYLGRGATSVEWLIDGVPFTQLGFDSLTVDPSLLPIGWVDRIEIEQLPGLLRVHLMFREQEVLAPWTRLSVARGTYEQARYEGILQKRVVGGFGYTVGVSYDISNGFNNDVGDFQAAHAWLEASYLPSARFGARLRYRLSTPDRDPSLAEGTPPRDTLARPLRRDRGDLEARVFFAQRNDGLGRQIDFLVTRSSWSYDTLRIPYLEPDFSQDLIRAGVVMTHRWAQRSVGGQLFYGSKWTRVDARANAGWALTERLTAALEGAYQVHQDSRASYWGMARAGLALPLGAGLSAAWRVGQVVAMPSVPGDQAQSISDGELTASLEQARMGARVSYTRTAAFSPVSYYQFAQVDTIGRQGPTEWVTGHLRLAPRQWLVFQGWYSTALGTQPEGTPNPVILNATPPPRYGIWKDSPAGVRMHRLLPS